MKAITLFLLGVALGVAIMPSAAHDPCRADDPDFGPDCRWDEVMNPRTGEIEQHYVCE